MTNWDADDDSQPIIASIYEEDEDDDLFAPEPQEILVQVHVDDDQPSPPPIAPEMFEDLRPEIGPETYSFADATTVPTAAEVFPGADIVMVELGPDDEYMATAQFENIDMVAYACHLNGWDYTDAGEEVKAIAWLDENSELITDFLETHGIEATGDEWREDCLVVSVEIDTEDAEAVTFYDAGIALSGSEFAVYLRDGLFRANRGLGVELNEYIEDHRA